MKPDVIVLPKGDPAKRCRLGGNQGGRIHLPLYFSSNRLLGNQGSRTQACTSQISLTLNEGIRNSYSLALTERNLAAIISTDAVQARTRPSAIIAC
jgi:hypothetical protein